MTKRGGRRAFLGVQWDCGSWDNLPSLCDLIINVVGKRPLVWNFPAAPSDTLQRDSKWLQKTVGARLGLDLVAAMGFAGACHPVLTLDELEKELSWGIENPWSTGISQVLNTRPHILMPRVADVLRADALAAYRRHGFAEVGIHNGRGVSWFAEDGLECFTCARISVASSRGIRRVPSRDGDTILMVDLSGAVTAESLEETLQLVMPWLAPEDAPSPLTTAHTSRGPVSAMAANGMDWSPFPAPLLRQIVSTSGAGARKKRKKNEEYREILAGLSLKAAVSMQTARPDPAEDSQPTSLPGGSHLVAQMLGEVSLAGNGFDVRLAGGRFAGITKDGHDVLPLRPARSYLRIAGKPLHFRTTNSFSFEGDGGTGLCEVLGINSQETASLTIEYSFSEGCPMLEVTADVRWPLFASGAVIEEHAPFVITLKELGRTEDALVEWEAPDGSTASLHVEGGGWTVAPGTLHRISLGGGAALFFRPGPAGSHGWSLASFRVARERHKRFLEANPFGGWFPLPASILSGRRERFSLLIGIET